MKKIWPYLAAFNLAVAGAVGALAYVFGDDAQVVVALMLAIGCAILGQLILMTMSLRQVKRDAAGFHSEFRRRTESFQSQIDALLEKGNAQASAVVNGINDLQNSYAQLQAMLETRVANNAAPDNAMTMAAVSATAHQRHVESAEQAQRQSPDTQYQDNHHNEAEEAAGQDDFASRVDVALEPVVNILTQRVAHYRMHLTMQPGNEVLTNEHLLHNAELMGKRSVLDLMAARAAVDLLAKLRQRDANLCVFVNIGLDSLTDDSVIAQLVELRHSAGSLGTGLVFELHHAMLADLPQQALEGLAVLARDGSFFALAQISVSGLDLKSMNILNVRYVQLSAQAIDASGPQASLVGFAQMARLSRITVIVTGLRDGALVSRLQNVTRLACGPCFAAPRRVRRRQPAADPIGMAA